AKLLDAGFPILPVVRGTTVITAERLAHRGLLSGRAARIWRTARTGRACRGWCAAACKAGREHERKNDGFHRDPFVIDLDWQSHSTSGARTCRPCSASGQPLPQTIGPWAHTGRACNSLMPSSRRGCDRPPEQEIGENVARYIRSSSW